MAQSAGPGLDDLPPELVQEIVSYLMGPLAPQNGQGDHALLHLAQASRNLRAHVEAFCDRELRRLGKEGVSFTHRWKSWAVQEGRPVLLLSKDSYRGLWLQFGRACCSWCGKKSVRKCLFNSEIKCCAKCQKKAFPPATTMTKALQSTKLPKSVLFPPPEFSIKPPMFRIPYYVFPSMGVSTTLVFCHDLDRLVKAFRELPAEEQKQLKGFMKTRRVVLDENNSKWRWLNPEAYIDIVDD